MKKRSKKNKIIFFFIMMVLSSCQKDNQAKEIENNLIELINPEKTVRVESFTASGILAPSSEVSLSAPVEGKVIQKTKEAGCHIRKGELLYLLENQDLLWQLEALQIAQKQLEEEKQRRAVELKDGITEAQKELINLENREIALQIKKNQIKEAKEQKRKLEEMVLLGAGVQSDVQLLENQIHNLELDFKSQQNTNKMALLGLQEEDLVERYHLKAPLKEEELKQFQIQKIIEPYQEKMRQIEESLSLNQREQHYIKQKMEHLKIVAPCEGYLFATTFQQGEWISPKEKVATIRVENPLTAIVRIPREHLNKVNEKKEYTITLFYNQDHYNTYKAKLDSILSGVDAATGEMALLLSIKNEKGDLQPGDYFEWVLEGENQPIWKVPLSAVREKKGKYEILFLIQNQIQILPIKGSMDAGSGFCIENPPEIEAPIINHPTQQMVEGDKIPEDRIQKKENANENTP